MRFTLLNLLLLCLWCTNASATTEYQVTDEETVSEILVKVGFPADYQVLLPFIEETMRLNPEVFRVPNPDWIQQGVTLTLPDNPFPPAAIAVPQITPEVTYETIQPIGRVAVTKGDYQVARLNRPPAPNPYNTVFEGDRVFTQDNTVIRIALNDNSLYVLGSNTEFLIEVFDYVEEERSERGFNAGFRTILGAVTALSGLVGGDQRDSYRMDTPLASVGIRGTEYTVRHCEENCGQLEGSATAVTDGSVAVSAGGIEESLDIGEFIQADESGELSDVKPIPEGFLDLESDPSQIEVEEFTWWQRVQRAVQEIL